MSRTTHELEKAKRRVHLAALNLRADPNSVEKQVALAEAIDDLERDRNTVQGAILKVLACSAVQPGYEVVTAKVAKGLDLRSEVKKGLEDHGVDTGGSINDGARPGRDMRGKLNAPDLYGKPRV